MSTGYRHCEEIQCLLLQVLQVQADKNLPFAIQSMVWFFVISGFHRGVNEIFALLGCYAAFICTYRRFGTPFKMGQISCTETSVTDYQSTLQSMAEEGRSCG